jgi:hypothetical protein
MRAHEHGGVAKLRITTATKPFGATGGRTGTSTSDRAMNTEDPVNNTNGRVSGSPTI